MPRSDHPSLTPSVRLIFAIATIAVLLIVASVEHMSGRVWWCACNEYYLWAGDILSRHNSQHLFDPYSFTHLLHGVALAGLVTLVFPQRTVSLRLFIAVVSEGAWEILENSSFIINRYRTETAAIGYQGDSIINSLGDVVCCAVGVMIAIKLGWRRSIAVFLLIEAILLIWIRDSLLLEIIMLIQPIASIKAWQLHH